MDTAVTTSPPKRLVVLGSTGSIGTSCLDVVDHLKGRFEVVGLSAHSRWDKLVEQAHLFRPRWVAVTCPEAAGGADPSQLPAGCRLYRGADSFLPLVAEPDVDVVNATAWAAAQQSRAGRPGTP